MNLASYRAAPLRVNCYGPLRLLVMGGLEPPTSGLAARRSISFELHDDGDAATSFELVDVSLHVLSLAV